MLHELRIENVAVVAYAEISFEQGLNVLTGETGAGKSIIIDSISAVTGARVSRELVRTGTERAVVTAEFDSAPVREWLLENDMDADEDLVILQRRIFPISSSFPSTVTDTACLPFPETASVLLLLSPSTRISSSWPINRLSVSCCRLS